MEVLLLEMTDGGVWSALVRPAAKLRPNETLLDEAGNEVPAVV